MQKPSLTSRIRQKNVARIALLKTLLVAALVACVWLWRTSSVVVGARSEQKAVLSVLSLVGEEDLECEPYNVPQEERCDFIREVELCAGDGLVWYLEFYFCIANDLYWLAIVTMVITLFFLFLFLGTIADDFFAPTMSELSVFFNLSPNVAGVTFLAVGNGAPDLAASFSAITSHSPDLGLSALMGAAVFVTSVIVGVITIMSSGANVEKIPMVRDVVSFLITSVLLMVVVVDGVITVAESIVLLSFYVLYVSFVVGWHMYEKRRNAATDAETLTNATVQDFSVNPSSSIAPYRALEDGEATSAVMSRSRGSSLTVFDPAVSETVNRKITGLLEEEIVQTEVVEEDGGWMQAWRSSGVPGKMLMVVQWPIQVVLMVTVPLADSWNCYLNALHLVTTPLLLVLAFELMPDENGWVVIVSVAGGGAVLALLLLWVTRKNPARPRFKGVWLMLAFLGGVAWLAVVADELVELLVAFGVVASLSEALLGLTILAVGNSMGDLIANVAVAKLGFAEMALAACFGSPLLNILVGAGAATLVKALESDDNRFDIGNSKSLIVCVSFMLAVVLSHAVVVPLSGWRFVKKYSYYLFALYAASLVVNILVTLEVIG